MTDSNAFFGFSGPKPAPSDQLPNPGENLPLGIDPGEWEHAGEKSAGSRQGGEFPLLPPGIHEVVASKVWTRQTPAGQTLLVIRWQGLHHPHRNASLLESLAIHAPNPKARAIALGRLKAICGAAGMRGLPTKPSDLHGVTLRILVAEKPDFRDPARLAPYVERHLAAGAV